MPPKVLQNNTNSNWMRDPGLRQLNLGISFMLAASATAGYCASMINGLLVLPECMGFHFISYITKQLIQTYSLELLAWS